MTIAVSVKVNDGVVLAADSAATLFGQAPGGIGAVKVYNNANKVFNLVKELPIGIVTWGAGSIGNASTERLIKDLREKLSHTTHEWKGKDGSYTVQDLASRLRNFIFDEKYQIEFRDRPDDQKPAIGFIIAGYSPGNDMAEEYQFTVDQGGIPSDVQPLRNTEDAGITWQGMIEPITRLVLGFSPLLPLILTDNLGVGREQIAPAMAIIQRSLEAPLALPPMPIKDAIDLAEYLVNVSIGYARFAPGAPTVGGEVEVAAITKYEGFKWVKRKYYYSREMNP